MKRRTLPVLDFAPRPKPLTHPSSWADRLLCLALAWCAATLLILALEVFHD